MAERGHPLRFNRAFLDAMFSSRTALTGGVVKRDVLDVAREIGEQGLRDEVRRRGFQLIRTQHQYVVVCNDAKISRLV
ncbi:MAG: N-(5'-phosphoribosyl)anthranilate isomerase [Pseudomonadota bacterium]